MAITQDRMMQLLAEAKALRDDGRAIRKELATAFRLYQKGDLTLEELPATIYALSASPTPPCDQLVVEMAWFTKVAAANDKRRARLYHKRRAAGIPEGVFGPPPRLQVELPPTFEPQPTPGGWTIDQIAEAIADPGTKISPTDTHIEGKIMPDTPPPDFSKGIF